jgi:hypothetical protein
MTRRRCSSMADIYDPWSTIEPPKMANDINRRRADPGHPLGFWYGRDFQGRYVFYLDSASEASSVKSIPRIAGLTLSLLPTAPDSCRLVLTLNDKELKDLFVTLSADLLRATAKLGRQDSGGLAIVVKRLLRWQELLGKARSQLLSSSEVIGLIGELLFLRDFMLPALLVNDVLHSWRGPYGDEQDFLLGGRIIEIKTQLSTSDEHLNIGSENQLDTMSGPIMVCHQTVYVPSTEEAGALSLNGLVAELAEQISKSDTAALHLFEAALIHVGYLKNEEYERPLWLLNTRSFLEVRETFPRLSAADIPEGVDRVRYQVSLQACKDFALDEAAAREWAFDV